jgi:hypothetical protein
MPDRNDLILNRLQTEGAKTAAYFRQLRPDQWNQQVYVSGAEWGALDLLRHFISVERTFLFYSRDAANGGPGVPRDFDIDAFNAREVQALRNAAQSPAELIAEFELQRAETIRFVEALDDDALDRIGFHPWFGDTSQENIFKLLYRHIMLHQRDLHRALETGRPVPHSEFIPPSQLAAAAKGTMSRKQAIRAHLDQNNVASLAILKAVTEDQWLTPVPSESDAPWTAKNLLTHLAIAEAGHVGQITRAAAGQDPVPADFDLSRYNRRSVQKAAEKSVSDLLSELETAYDQLVAKLGELDDSDLDKTARHARGDVLTVEGFFLRCSDHRLEHAQQLQTAIRA